MTEQKAYQVFTDGGARGNPGPASIGVVILDGLTKMLVEQFGEKIGSTTNNVAEYLAVVKALKWFKKNRAHERLSLDFFLDSKLVVNQLNGLFRVKDGKLRNLILEVRKCEIELKGEIFYHHIPRERNQAADKLVKIFSSK